MLQERKFSEAFAMAASGITQVILPLIGGIFMAIGIALLVIANRNAKHGMRIASKSRMKVAVIFLIVGVGLGGYFLFSK